MWSSAVSTTCRGSEAISSTVVIMVVTLGVELAVHRARIFSDTSVFWSFAKVLVVSDSSGKFWVLHKRHLLKMVDKIFFSSSVCTRMVVCGGGSSRVLRSAFCASRVAVWNCCITPSLVRFEKGLRLVHAINVLTASIFILPFSSGARMK